MITSPRIQSVKQLLESGAIRRAGHNTRPTLPTGLHPIDERLGGGLALGATHEWYAPGPHPPLTVLAHLASRMSSRGGLLIWIGRACWPTCEALGSGGEELECSVFVDPPTVRERLWAIDQALRCVEVACVVADASGLDLAATRRLQLAAEAGAHTLGFLARPASEFRSLSAAWTRWTINPEPGSSNPRWRLELWRCKGQGILDRTAWSIEMSPGGKPGEPCALRLAPDMGDRPRTATLQLRRA